ncbi:hypothetical protein K5D32_11750 [Pseudomonas cichorii]|uniref:HEPN domain-containing protein n=1 Tax=Pseudomonas cichorii TaxID=36746 RepID=UPI001C8A5C15|nr:HEPN domain-containing protein [Pseudomonas cichorii]MBX8530343.1 hypothetical protein [Pseudomonas cichorii]
MKIEFLILISGDETFCNSKRSLLDFLKVDSLLTVANSRIGLKKTPRGKEEVSAKIHIETSEVKSSNERYFLVAIECENTELIDQFSELGERLKTNARRISPGATMVNMLWDGVGSYYAEMSYPIINEVENLMRRLIAKFMLITVGMNWSKDSIHPDLFKKIEQFDDGDPYLNELHKLDFIHLSQVLFEKKRDIGVEELDRILSATKFEEGDREKILKYIPRSNWDKYFSTLIDEKDHSLERKWAMLYKLRNKVAHNRVVTREEYETVQGLASKIKSIIERAILKLGEISIEEDERESIVLSYKSESFAARQFQLERAVAMHYSAIGYEYDTNPLRHLDSGFDLTITMPGETIAVEIKILSPRTVYHLLRAIVGKVSQKWNELKEVSDYTGVHIVIVFKDYGVSLDLGVEKLKSRVRVVRSKLEQDMKIYFGALDEDGVFQYLDDI